MEFSSSQEGKAGGAKIKPVIFLDFLPKSVESCGTAINDNGAASLLTKEGHSMWEISKEPGGASQGMVFSLTNSQRERTAMEDT